MKNRDGLRVLPILMTVLALLIFVLPGCTLRNRNGEIIQAKRPVWDQPEESQPAKESEEKQQETTSDFEELSPDEREDLTSTETQPPEAVGIRKKEEEVQEIAPEETPSDSQPTRITGRPKSALPLMTRLYPVPAIAEAQVFDPEIKHRAKKKAALDLTDQGRQAMDQGKVELAISKFQKAISADPNVGYSYFYFARARFLQEDWDQVVALADKAALHLRENPEYLSRAYLLKAQALSNQKRYIPALAACESAIDADTTNVQAKLLRNRIKDLY